MKVSRSLPAGLALAGLLLAPSIAQSRPVSGGQATDAPSTRPRWSIAVRGADGTTEVRDFDAPPIPSEGGLVVTRGLAFSGVPLPSDDDLGSDVESILRAMKVLDERGYEEEAARLRDIHQELRARAQAKSIDARAAKLLEQDVSDRAVRTQMLEVVADGYGAAGWETNEASMRWIVDVGRSQLPGGTPVDRPVPAGLRTDSSQSMQRAMIELVAKGAEIQQKLGNLHAAAMCARLTDFYEARARGMQAEEEPPAEAESKPMLGLGYVGVEVDPRTKDLTYIEGRVPVLELARNAYGLTGGDMGAEERERGRAWTQWLYTSGRNRVVDEPVDLPPLPGPVSMDSIIRTIRRAGDIYDANNRPKEAKRCRALADYYRKREAGEAVDNSRTQPRPPVARDIEPEEPVEPEEPMEPSSEPARSEIDARRKALQIQIRDLEAQIKALQLQIEKRRGGGGRR